MFQEAFEKLELDEIALILDQVNPSFEGTIFDPVNTVIMALDLAFYPEYRLMEIADHTVSPPVQRFILYKQDHHVVLDFTNTPIYKLNKELPIALDEENIGEYLRFFFTYVKGRHGRFQIAESVDEVNWKEEPPPSARKAIGKMLKPITIESQEKGDFSLVATMIFKDSLFRSKVKITKDGAVSLFDEELLIEDMPVLDDVFGQ